MRFPRRNKIARNCDLDKNIKYREILEFKPTCYWYSLGSEWYNFWYKKEGHKVTNEVVCEIKIKKDMFTNFGEKNKGKILVIDSLEEVKKLNKKYSVSMKMGKSKDVKMINFQKLSEIYGGVEFRNYKKIKKQIMETKRNNLKEYNWYNMLGVSSGCVWDLSLIDVEKKGKLKDFV